MDKLVQKTHKLVLYCFYNPPNDANLNHDVFTVFQNVILNVVFQKKLRLFFLFHILIVCNNLPKYKSKLKLVGYMCCFSWHTEYIITKLRKVQLMLQFFTLREKINCSWLRSLLCIKL